MYLLKFIRFQKNWLILYNYSTVPKLSRPPVIDEMVLGEYNGEYYRGRVTKINGDKYKVVFVDFGDAQEMPYTEMYPISEYLLEVINLFLCRIIEIMMSINV